MSERHETKWILKPKPEGRVGGASVPRILSHLLSQRGVKEEDVDVFLQPRLRDLQDPYQLPEMDLAVTRIFQAIDKGEEICVYGDYDVDGITSVALMHKALSAYGAKVSHFIPRRGPEGYGLSDVALKRLFEENENIDLLITVDCGTASVQEVAAMVEKNIDVIIVDHHEMSPAGRPDCVALVNPKYKGGNFEYLCAAGVVFKLIHGMLINRRINNFDLKDFIDIVAVATIADIVPLVEENRLLVRHGLRRLPETKNLGLKALQKVAGVKEKVSSLDVGFRVGPRLNAAGRMDEPCDALRILLTEDQDEAYQLAQKLDQYNQERQNHERQIRDEALQMIEEDPEQQESAVIVLGSRQWHPGVVGIVASRLMRQFYKPAFVIAIDEHGHGKGSGRSVDGVSLVKAIHESSEYLMAGGGHDMAAGISIEEDKISVFRKSFSDNVKKQASSEERAPRLYVDAEVDFEELSLSFLDSYELLQPFGSKNPQPVFMAREVWLTESPRHLKNNHIKLFMRQNYCEKDAIFFGGGERILPDPPWDIAFTIDRNNFRGRTSLQVVIQDIRSASAD